MAQTKNSGAKKGNRTKTGQKTGKKNTKNIEKKAYEDRYVLTEKDLKIREEAKLLLALGITVLLLISNFGLISPVGDYISYFMFGMTGVLGYILPILIFLATAFLISNRNNKRAIIKFATATAFVWFVLAMIQLIFSGYQTDHSCFYYYFHCGETKSGGGFFGALLVNILCRIVGVVGTYILLIVYMIIAGVLFTEKSFIGGVRQGSKKVYDSARDEVVYKIRDNVRENAKEKDYQKNRRIHKVAKGVNLSRIEDPEKDAEDMHEIDAKNFRKENKDEENLNVIQTGKKRKKTIAERHELMNQTKLEPVAPEEEQEVQEIPENFRQEASGHSFIKAVEDIPVEKPESRAYIDEEGNFKVKEEIQVSESAKKVMDRPAFSAFSAVTKEKSNPDGIVEIPKADVENTVYEKQQTEKPAKARNKGYVLPKTSLLNRSQNSKKGVNQQELHQTALKLEQILQNFGVKAKVVDFNRGPSVTRYEIQPEIGTRLNKITTLADDIKLNLAATDIRIEPIPGKSTIGIEVPNKDRESVLIRDLIESKELTGHKSKLAFAAGKDIAGQVVVADIAKMPHFLIAGTTGSGKSVFTNSIIMSILFRATPEEVRLIIVDPKVVEFGIYNGIPHLLQPVVTDPKLASNTLKWAVAEMSDRYKKFAEFNVRDLKGYNEKVRGMTFMDESERPKKLPQIVIVIDELADLMMVAAKEVESSICRLAQLARAAGIHLIIATQRPSVDVVTGLIKANIPSRCALMVSSAVDSRTIIDSGGAEKLLGNGDMLFYPSGYVKPVRLQGAFVSDAEVERVVEYWKAQANGSNYDEAIAEYVASQPVEEPPGGAGAAEDHTGGRDEYFKDAARLVVEKQKASTSMLQRIFKIGFNRAARIVEQLEEAGIVGEEEGTKPRKVLVTQVELENLLNNIS
ncbi:MAG: DNA translocase FtsK [Lachnospiraceae bacterium]|nr:DNA translocase FtsK [Lachnospiraceae bacterium]